MKALPWCRLAPTISMESYAALGGVAPSTENWRSFGPGCRAAAGAAIAAGHGRHLLWRSITAASFAVGLCIGVAALYRSAPPAAGGRRGSAVALLAGPLRGWNGRPPVARLVQTALGTGDRLALRPDVPLELDFPWNGSVLDIGSEPVDEALVGFGGAFTEASAVVFWALPAEMQRRILERYFGPDGIGYTIGRVPINSCDFSVGTYSFDDVADDFDLRHFDDNVTHDTMAMIPFIKAAKAMVASTGKELRLFAAPWSPPAWMKRNDDMNTSPLPGLRPGYGDVWARYITKWITAYKAHGLSMWAITPQNEPEWNAHYEACLYTPEGEATFVGSHLGPVLKAAHPEVRLLVFDHNKHDVHIWANTLYSDLKAAAYIDGVAFHWYSGDHFDNVAKVRQAHPGVILLPSEATYERIRESPDAPLDQGQWNFGEGYAHDIIGDLNAGASGWTDWNLLLDERGGPNHAGNTCDAAMRANLSQGVVYEHPQFYFIAHFSKYLPPGSRRLPMAVHGTRQFQGAKSRPYGTCTAEDGLQATAFKRPDGDVAVVVLNCAASSLDFKLRHGGVALHAKIPARAVQTYMLPVGGF